MGDRAAYSNIGYLLAGEVIAAVTGRSVQDSVRDAVLQTLGINTTGYAYGSQAPRATGYVRVPSAVVPVLRGVLPNGIVGQRIDGQTALRPFPVSGAAYVGIERREHADIVARRRQFGGQGLDVARDAAGVRPRVRGDEGDPHPRILRGRDEGSCSANPL